MYPYFHTFTSYVKGRWLGRTVWDVFTKEFHVSTEENLVRIHFFFFFSFVLFSLFNFWFLFSSSVFSKLVTFKHSCFTQCKNILYRKFFRGFTRLKPECSFMKEFQNLPECWQNVIASQREYFEH